MSGIVNSTIGLLCNKVRDYTAQRLNEGDINNSELSQITVREIDDIKTKLDALSRKDLLASLSFLRDGVNQLYIFLEKYGKSCENPNTSQAHTEDDKLEGATFVMHIITMDGTLKHEVHVPFLPVTFPLLSSINVVFNHVNKTILVNWVSLFILSKTGEQLYDFETSGYYSILVDQRDRSVWM